METGITHDQVFTAIEALKQTMIYEGLKTIEQSKDSLPPQVLLQQPVTFIDALDRVSSFHLDWIDSHEAFLAVLKCRFRNYGHQMIENGRFAIQASKTKRDINLNKPWNVCLFPGQEYDMSMLFQDPNRGNDTSCTSCTSCHEICPGKPGDEITW